MRNGENRRNGTGNGAAAPRNSRFHGRMPAQERVCEHPDCEEPGEFRAPRTGAGDSGDLNRDNADLALRWRWFCLDHVRAFNAGYNYFEGMNADEIERAQRIYSGWDRETRAFAGSGDPEPAWTRFTDPADVLGARFSASAVQRPVSRNGQVLSAEDRKALKALDLGADASLSDIRRAYAERVRRFHPDRNGGDRTHERALQAAISAYTHLRKAPAFS